MTDEAPASEHLETAERIADARGEGRWKEAAIPLSIAVMAVIAAVFASLETTAASDAVVARSDAAIRQGEATDLWGYFQAHSVKRNMYEIAADQPGADAAKLRAKAQQHADEEAMLQAKAKSKEAEVAVQVARSESAMERHHQLTYATSIIHLAIAIASISILIRQRWLWAASLVCLAAGVVLGLI